MNILTFNQDSRIIDSNELLRNETKKMKINVYKSGQCVLANNPTFIISDTRKLWSNFQSIQSKDVSLYIK